MNRLDLGRLDPRHPPWVLAVVAPCRDWASAPGCRRGARFMVDPETLQPSRDEFGIFDSQLSCLQWMMRHRTRLNQALPGAAIRPVRLDRWLLGLE